MTTYLSKTGKIFGPFTDAEILGLKSSGEYVTFSWQWTQGSPSWQPINPPLALPPELAQGPQPPATRAPVPQAPNLDESTDLEEENEEEEEHNPPEIDAQATEILRSDLEP